MLATICSTRPAALTFIASRVLLPMVPSGEAVVLLERLDRRLEVLVVHVALRRRRHLVGGQLAGREQPLRTRRTLGSTAPGVSFRERRRPSASRRARRPAVAYEKVAHGRVRGLRARGAASGSRPRSAAPTRGRARSAPGRDPRPSARCRESGRAAGARPCDVDAVAHHRLAQQHVEPRRASADRWHGAPDERDAVGLRIEPVASAWHGNSTNVDARVRVRRGDPNGADGACRRSTAARHDRDFDAVDGEVARSRLRDERRDIVGIGQDATPRAAAPPARASARASTDSSRTILPPPRFDRTHRRPSPRPRTARPADRRKEKSWPRPTNSRTPRPGAGRHASGRCTRCCVRRAGLRPDAPRGAKEGPPTSGGRSGKVEPKRSNSTS